MECELADISLDLGVVSGLSFSCGKTFENSYTSVSFSKKICLQKSCRNFNTALYFSLTYLAFEIPYRGDWKIQQGG